MASTLYPPLEPYQSGMLPVSRIHTIYYEQCGNPAGHPVVFLHGGPGGGVGPDDRRYFDPQFYRIVLFDQRGAGKSEPHACLEENTTWHLVEDIEKLRAQLGISVWTVFGGSWGSTLALSYAEAHPQRVDCLILRGIFTLRREELLWFYQEGASFLFPDYWEEYLDAIPEAERADMMGAYYRRLTGPNEAERLRCAETWSKWECATAKLFPDPAMIAKAGDPHWALAFARIECHYFVHAGFFTVDGQLIKNAHKIRHIPCTIVQGRYDTVCPMKSAWDLHRAWPEAKLLVVPDAGHSAKEPGIQRALVDACDQWRDAQLRGPRGGGTVSEVESRLGTLNTTTTTTTTSSSSYSTGTANTPSRNPPYTPSSPRSYSGSSEIVSPSATRTLSSAAKAQAQASQRLDPAAQPAAGVRSERIGHASARYHDPNKESSASDQPSGQPPRLKRLQPPGGASHGIFG